MKRALLVLSLLPLACTEPEIEPATGRWDFVEGEMLSNSCGSMVDISSGEFELVNNGDGTFTVDPQDSEVTFDCTLAGDAFECPERVQVTVMQPGIDATIEILLSESGTFSSNTAASGQRDGTATCSGAACGLAEAAIGATFPCSASIAFTASFKG